MEKESPQYNTEHGQLLMCSTTSTEVCIPLLVSTHPPSVILRVDKVIMLTHTYLHKSLAKEIKVAISNHKVDSPFCLWPDVYFGDLQARKRVLS